MIYDFAMSLSVHSPSVHPAERMQAYRPYVEPMLWMMCVAHSVLVFVLVALAVLGWSDGWLLLIIASGVCLVAAMEHLFIRFLRAFWRMYDVLMEER